MTGRYRDVIEGDVRYTKLKDSRLILSPKPEYTTRRNKTLKKTNFFVLARVR